SDAENQLDYFRSLHHANESRQNPKNAPFRARRHQARRWRLRIQAAIARPVFRREHAGLTFKAEDRSVDIRLASQHTSIVYQIPRREVIGSIGDDVEFAK